MACPAVVPWVGSPSSSRAEASLAVSSAVSADVPPMTRARWYGGQAEVPRVRSLSSSQPISVVGLSSALVSWNSRLLLAEPPPLAMNSSLYSSPSPALILISAGRLVLVLTSSQVVSGAICE